MTSESKPEARMVIFTLSSSDSSRYRPHITSTSSSMSLTKSVSWSVSDILKGNFSSSLLTYSTISSFLERMMSVLHSRGEFSASLMALLTRFSPSP